MEASTDPELQGWHNYEIASPREIMSLLRQIGEKNALVRMLVQGERDVCVTSILDIDARAGTMLLDCSINRDQNVRILAQQQLRIETSLDNIRIVFVVAGLASALYEGRPALRCSIPATLVRLQRREYYRMAVPLTSPVRVAIPLPAEAAARAAADSAASSFTLADISVGGLSIIDHKRMLGTAIGHKIAGCNLTLPDGIVSMTLAVRNTVELALLNGKTSHRLGCEFIDLSRASLAHIQRYITKLERERNARMAGLG
jgi:c-di-GMP-binding flagellar brake protein YcgR